MFVVVVLIFACVVLIVAWSTRDPAVRITGWILAPLMLYFARTIWVLNYRTSSRRQKAVTASSDCCEEIGDDPTYVNARWKEPDAWTEREDFPCANGELLSNDIYHHLPETEW